MLVRLQPILRRRLTFDALFYVCKVRPNVLWSKICLQIGRGPASPLVHPPPQLNKMGIIRKLRVSTLQM